MKEPEEYIEDNNLLNKGMKANERFALGLTRDCHVGTMKNIIKAIKQAQKDAWNEAVKECAKNARTKYDIAIFAEGTYRQQVVDEQSILKLLKE